MIWLRFAHACYFTLRSGGRTFITFLFDSVFTWAINIPAAYILGYHTQVPVVQMYFIVQGLPIIKCIIGFVLVKKGVWIRNIVAPAAAKEETK